MRFHFWYPIFVRMISSWILDIFCILHFSCDSFYSVLLFVYLAKPKNTIYRLEWKQNEREKAKDCIGKQWTIDKIGIERKYKKTESIFSFHHFLLCNCFLLLQKYWKKQHVAGQQQQHDWQSWERTNDPKKFALHKMKWHKSNKWTKKTKRGKTTWNEVETIAA